MRRGSGGAGAPTVLVAEDETIVRDLVQQTLERAGYRVLVAADGDEALRLGAASTHPVDVLVTDMVMPGMNGGELAQRVLEASPSTPVVFMSGYTTEAVPAGRDGGADGGLLEKPFPMTTLVERVEAALASGATSESAGRPARPRRSPIVSARCWHSSPTATRTTAPQPSSGSPPRPCSRTFAT